MYRIFMGRIAWAANRIFGPQQYDLIYYLPPIPCLPLPATHYLPPIICHPLPATHYLPPITCYPFPASHCLPPITCHPLSATHYLPPIPCLPLPATHYLPPSPYHSVSKSISNSYHSLYHVCRWHILRMPICPWWNISCVGRLEQLFRESCPWRKNILVLK